VAYKVTAKDTPCKIVLGSSQDLAKGGADGSSKSVLLQVGSHGRVCH
jgi:hypothetical protein